MRHFSKDKLKADLKEYQFKNIDLEKLATSSVSKLQKTIRNNFAEIAAKHYYCKFSKKQNNCPTGKPPIDCPYFHYNTCLERFINLFPDYKAIVGKNNDNTIILFNPYQKKHIVTDNRKILPLLKTLPTFSLPDDNLPIVMKYTLQKWQNNLIPIPNIKTIPSQSILYGILSIADYILQQKYQNTSINTLMSNNSEMTKIHQLMGLESRYLTNAIINYQKFFRSTLSMELTARIVKILHTLTDGNISKLDELAKTIAKILLTKKVCKYLNIDKNRISIIKTSNKYFVKQFFRGLFLPKHYFDIYKDMISFNPLNNSEAVDCTRLFSDDGLSYGCIYTEYSLAELCDKKNIGKFIEDSFDGHLLNVCTNINNADKYNLAQLEKMADGTVIYGYNDILGKQEYRASDYNIFIIEDADELKKFSLSEEKYSYFNLSDQIDIHQYIFDCCETFEKKEIVFILQIIGKYGLDLLLKQKSPCKENSSSNPADLFELFINNCCTLVPFEPDTKPDATNATAKITLESAYKIFCTALNTRNSGIIKIDEKLLSNYKVEAHIVKAKNNAVRNRDLQNGYDEEEVLAKDSNAGYVAGIVIRSKNDIIDIANNLWDKSDTSDSLVMTLDDFADFLCDLSLKYSPAKHAENV